MLEVCELQFITICWPNHSMESLFFALKTQIAVAMLLVLQRTLIVCFFGLISFLMKVLLLEDLMVLIYNLRGFPYTMTLLKSSFKLEKLTG